MSYLKQNREVENCTFKFIGVDSNAYSSVSMLLVKGNNHMVSNKPDHYTFFNLKCETVIEPTWVNSGNYYISLYLACSLH